MEQNDKPLDTNFSCERVKAELKIYYGPSEVTILSGSTVDVSTGGLYVGTSFPLKKHQRLKLIFSLPNHEEQKPITCSARVAWVNNEDKAIKPELIPGVGLEFLDISSEDLNSIANLLEIHSAESFNTSIQ